MPQQGIYKKGMKPQELDNSEPTNKQEITNATETGTPRWTQNYEVGK
jgi:hypothetical protein